MKILQLQPNWKTYSEVWLLRMNDYLKNNLYAIGAFAPNEKNWNNIPIFDLYGKIPPLSIRALNKLKFKGLNKFYPPDWEIIKYIYGKETDTIFIQFIGPALHFKDLLINSGKKIIIHVHGNDIFFNATRSDNPAKRLHQPNYIELINEISRYVTFISNSKFTTNELLKMGISESNIKLKYFGVNLPDLKNRLEKKNILLNILFLGRLVDFKGPEIVIHAFDLACKNGLQACLTIAGDGDLRQYCELLRLRSAYKDRIEILGSVNYETAQILYAKADIYTMHNCYGLLSNTEEAFGVSIIEAMSFALPVITGNSGAIFETVIDGETGIVVDQFNIQQHAQAFIKLAENQDLRYKMGMAGRERIKNIFNPEQEKNKLFEILNLKNNA